ncbi:MAG: hypothetical protein ACTHNP_02435 [Solirubrobacterales bacterium]
MTLQGGVLSERSRQLAAQAITSNALAEVKPAPGAGLRSCPPNEWPGGGPRMGRIRSRKSIPCR